MTTAEFRKLALSLPDTAPGAHMGHADYRVAGKIFATSGYPKPGWGMVKLQPDEQELFCRSAPHAFVPVKGGWGRAGATNVILRHATKAAVREALQLAWEHTAPKKGTPKSGFRGL